MYREPTIYNLQPATLSKIIFVFLWFVFGCLFLVSSAHAQEATTTPTDTPIAQEDIASSTLPTTEPEPQPEPEPTATSTSPAPAIQEPATSTATSTTPEPPAPGSLDVTITEIMVPATPQVTPVVAPANAGNFDPKTAPSKVKIKVMHPSGNPISSPIFITYVGVGGKTYGGQLNKDGELETIMPTGRYYTDILVIDTLLGPPTNPPSFFLEANEERDLGAFILSDKSMFVDPLLENQIASTLGDGGVKGLARAFSLVVKLLLSILQEVRSLRSELAWR